MTSSVQRTDWYGTAKSDSITGGSGNNLLFGNAGNDVLTAGEGEGVSVLVGGEGQDRLVAGSQSDTFRYVTESDSYVDSTGGHSDLIVGFDPAHDMLDLTTLRLDGIGQGYGGKVDVVYNETLDRTYLRSYEHPFIPGQDLKYFQVALQGDYRTSLTNANFWNLEARDRFDDTLTGTDAGQETLFGDIGRDTLNGAGGDDRIDGGEDGDTLTGGSGADIFFFAHAEDSYRVDGTDVRNRDVVTDFNAADGDLVDLSLLGFSGLGDGHHGTLKLSVNAAGNQTSLRSLDVDAQGRSFEILFKGDVREGLSHGSVIFATNDTGTVIEHKVELVGVAPVAVDVV
ncbi:hypothetical protein [Pseudomonas sp. RC10]|uniref:hypothetical protein n=1 Tax=Pseudomonas bambusae TaxID=3139142 RepID=UPI00313A0EED